MQIGSLFSGIGGFDLGLTSPVSWQVEKDKDCNRVLAHHFPETKRFNDVKEVGKANLTPVDLICGGFPCQDLSVAGKRKGLDGERSGLWFEFARIIDELEPGWVLIENVPGLLSSGEGRDFAIILQWLAGRGYCVAWRVFDSQYFGVAQRRKRVFVVASFGNGRAAEVLFESSCCCGDIAPSRATGKGTAGAITERTRSSGRQFETQPDISYCLDNPGAGGRTQTRMIYQEQIAPTLRGGTPGGSTHGKPSGMDQGPFVVHANQDPCTSRDLAYALSGTSRNAVAKSLLSHHNRSNPEQETFVLGFKSGQSAQSRSLGIEEELSPSLEGGGGGNNKPCVAIQDARAMNKCQNGFGINEEDLNYTLDSTGSQGVCVPMLVRRLTPTECLRLQGFPDHWLDLTPALSNSAKYRMTGNAVAVPVIQWIGLKIRELSI